MLDELDCQNVSNEVMRELVMAQKPIIICGAGMRKWAAEIREIADYLKVPVCTTWGARDLFPDCVGAFGTHGVTAANLAIHEADYILALGARLDTKATGYPVSSFAPAANLVMVDVDPAEMGKMEQLGRPLYRSILSDIGDFLRHFGSWFRAYRMENGGEDDEFLTEWQRQITRWKATYPAVRQEWKRDPLNPYAIIDGLSDEIGVDDIIVCDTGCSLAWMMQAYRFKGETFLHPFNQTPMGCALGYAVGAAFATGKKVWVITGDGGLSLGISEMATIAKHDLPVTIILFNNHGHAMCRQTQRQWMGGEYPATSDQDLATPNFVRIAAAYGVELREYEISESHGVHGQVKFGEPLVKEAA